MAQERMLGELRRILEQTKASWTVDSRLKAADGAGLCQARARSASALAGDDCKRVEEILRLFPSRAQPRPSLRSSLAALTACEVGGRPTAVWKTISLKIIIRSANCCISGCNIL